MPNEMENTPNRFVVNETQINTPLPPPPDPTYNGARFLAWLSKRGYMRDFKDCERECERCGINIETIVRTWGLERIKIYRGRGGEKVVVLEDKAWASQWTRYYDTTVPHHKHMRRIEK